jgi:hypothetical protein
VAWPGRSASWRWCRGCWSLNRTRSFLGALASGWLMSLTFVGAVLPWFGAALGHYTGIGTLPALLVLLALAPLLQPQVLATRWCASGPTDGMARAGGAGRRQRLGGCEWLLPKLLGRYARPWSGARGLSCARWPTSAARRC